MALPLLQLGVGHDCQQRAVLVVEQLGADEVLEEPPFDTRPVQVLEIRVEFQRRERIPSVEIGGHRREQHAQRVRETGVAAFALLEFQVVDRGVDL